MFSPGLEVLVQAGANPVLILGNSNFAVIRRDSLCDPAEIRDCVVINPNPVADVATGHPFKVEKIAERKRCHKYGDRCSCFRITPIMKAQSFSSIVQFCIDTRETLDVESNVDAVEPIGVTPTKLTVAQRPPSVYDTDCLVLLPKMLQRLALLGQGTMDFLRVEISVQFTIDQIASFLVQKTCNEFVCNVFRQRIRQLVAFPEAFKKLADSGFPITCCRCDFPAAHSIGKMDCEHSLVVHMRTSSKWIPLP